MKNKLSDLNNILFEQIERINDDSLTEEQFEQAAKKAKVISDISSKIIQGAATQLKAVAVMDNLGYIKPDTEGIMQQLGFTND